MSSELLSPFSRQDIVSQDDDYVRFVLENTLSWIQCIYCTSSLKQQSAGRHVTPLEHIILNFSQKVFALTP